jgi:hypothetical protein
MVKNSKRWIAFFVALSFVWLMQVSAMPVAAAGTAEQAGIAAGDQGPDYHEAVGQKAAPAKKGSILPWILIGAGVITVTALVLILFVLKSYDITGEWQYFWKDTGDVSWAGNAQKLVFSGAKKSGTLIYLNAYPGTYTVSGKDVTFKFQYGSNDSVTHTGTFATKDKISGTWIYDQDPSFNGSWEAIRVAAAAQVTVPQSSPRMPGKNKPE